MLHPLCFLSFTMFLSTVVADENNSSSIEQWQKERDQEELQTLNLETEGQTFFFADWPNYAHIIEQAKEHQDKAIELQHKIDTVQKKPPSP